MVLQQSEIIKIFIFDICHSFRDKKFQKVAE